MDMILPSLKTKPIRTKGIAAIVIATCVPDPDDNQEFSNPGYTNRFSQNTKSREHCVRSRLD
jgi:hypothetical protein